MRIDAALDAMKQFGFPPKLVRDTVKELLDVGFSDFLSVIVIDCFVCVCASSVAVICWNVGTLVFQVIKQERMIITLSFFYIQFGVVIIYGCCLNFFFLFHYFNLIFMQSLRHIHYVKNFFRYMEETTDGYSLKKGLILSWSIPFSRSRMRVQSKWLVILQACDFQATFVAFGSWHAHVLYLCIQFIGD